MSMLACRLYNTRYMHYNTKEVIYWVLRFPNKGGIIPQPTHMHTQCLWHAMATGAHDLI